MPKKTNLTITLTSAERSLCYAYGRAISVDPEYVARQIALAKASGLLFPTENPPVGGLPREKTSLRLFDYWSCDGRVFYGVALDAVLVDGDLYAHVPAFATSAHLLFPVVRTLNDYAFLGFSLRSKWADYPVVPDGKPVEQLAERSLYAVAPNEVRRVDRRSLYYTNEAIPIGEGRIRAQTEKFLGRYAPGSARYRIEDGKRVLEASVVDPGDFDITATLTSADEGDV